MCYSYEHLPWIDEAAYYFRLHYAAQPFCRVRDTGHEWEILFATGKGPKHPWLYYAASFKQAKRWIDGYTRYHEHKLKGQEMRMGAMERSRMYPGLSRDSR